MNTQVSIQALNGLTAIDVTPQWKAYGSAPDLVYAENVSISIGGTPIHLTALRVKRDEQTHMLAAVDDNFENVLDQLASLADDRGQDTITITPTGHPEAEYVVWAVPHSP